MQKARVMSICHGTRDMILSQITPESFPRGSVGVEHTSEPDPCLAQTVSSISLWLGRNTRMKHQHAQSYGSGEKHVKEHDGSPVGSPFPWVYNRILLHITSLHVLRTGTFAL